VYAQGAWDPIRPQLEEGAPAGGSVTFAQRHLPDVHQARSDTVPVTLPPARRTEAGAANRPAISLAPAAVFRQDPLKGVSEIANALVRGAWDCCCSQAITRSGPSLPHRAVIGHIVQKMICTSSGNKV